MIKTTRKRTISSGCVAASGLLLLSICAGGLKEAHAFSIAPTGLSSCSSYSISSQFSPCSLKMGADDDDQPPPKDGPAGSFFHQVPPSDDSSSSSNENDSDSDKIATNGKDVVGATSGSDDNFDDAVSKLIQQRRKKPLASRPSTINGMPTEKATGFGKPKKETVKKQSNKDKPITPYVAIGQPDQPINDPSKPESDDQGYTLYTDTKTGEKSRVFEALVDYPSVFTMKIVGANEGTFVPEIVALVAEACESDVEKIQHSTRVSGKWVSVTVHAPVKSAEMLYSLYEKVDLDPRVKFKF